MARAAGNGEGDPGPHVPISENFSVAERATIVGVTLTGVVALTVAPRIWQPAPSFGEPALGSLDRNVSDALYSANGTGATVARISTWECGST